MDKRAELAKIAKKIMVCKKCRLWKRRHFAVPGEGNSNAKILFLGESPGKEENRVGRPFVGPAGKFLDALFKKIDLEREKVFISSVIKCHPSKNRNPRSDELAACKIWWQKQIKIIQPKIIVPLGAIAFKTVLKKGDLSQCHGQKIERNNIIYFPTFHPAAGRRFPKIKKLIIADFKKIKNLR